MGLVRIFMGCVSMAPDFIALWWVGPKYPFFLDDEEDLMGPPLVTILGMDGWILGALGGGGPGALRCGCPDGR